MSDLLIEIIKLVAAFAAGATIGPFIIKIRRSKTDNTRNIKQSRVTVGRDNNLGDRNNSR